MMVRDRTREEVNDALSEADAVLKHLEQVLQQMENVKKEEQCQPEDQ